MDNNEVIKKRLIDLRESSQMSQSELGRRSHLDNSVISKIEKGTRKVSADELKTFADIFDVSTDYLLGKSNKHHYYDLTEKDEIDIAEQAEQIIKGIQTSADVNFYGEPATKEQMESMRDIIETGLRINKEKAKKKFTPKKYRDNGAKGGD